MKIGWDFPEDFHDDSYGDEELLFWNNWPKKTNWTLFPVRAIAGDSTFVTSLRQQNLSLCRNSYFLDWRWRIVITTIPAGHKKLFFIKNNFGMLAIVLKHFDFSFYLFKSFSKKWLNFLKEYFYKKKLFDFTCYNKVSK